MRSNFVYDVWLATPVVAMGGGDAQELVLRRILATRRYGLHNEAHHASYYFFLL